MSINSKIKVHLTVHILDLMKYTVYIFLKFGLFSLTNVIGASRNTALQNFTKNEPSSPWIMLLHLIE